MVDHLFCFKSKLQKKVNNKFQIILGLEITVSNKRKNMKISSQ